MERILAYLEYAMRPADSGEQHLLRCVCGRGVREEAAVGAVSGTGRRRHRNCCLNVVPRSTTGDP